MARIESLENRVQRLLHGGMEEITGTLLNSLQNFFLREIEALTIKQTNLLVLGTHALMQIVGEQIAGLKPIKATAFYLKHFVDQASSDRRFSDIAPTLHEWRNVVAHAGFGRLGHEIGIDETMALGFEQRGDTLWINPAIYQECFVSGMARVFSYRFNEGMTPHEDRTRTFEFCRGFLELERENPVNALISAFAKVTEAGELQQALDKAIVAILVDEAKKPA